MSELSLGPTASRAAPEADFNVDGNVDVAVSHAGALFTYLTGKGSLAGAPFNTGVPVVVNTMATSVVAAPFKTNTDLLYDVVTTSTNTNNLSISLNVCQ